MASLLALAVLTTAGASRADVDPLLAGTPSEHAGEDEGLPRPMVALAAGAAMSFVSIAAGTTALARAETRTGKNTGLLAAGGGLCLSPFVAHAVVGEWGRGALFSVVPVLAEVGLAALVDKAPNVVTSGGASEQLAFITLLGAAVLSSGIGVVDVAKADERAARDGVRLTPIFGHGQAGLAIGGVL